MSQGYLVQLGDGTLDPDDAIALSAVGFEIDQTIGTGTWVWTGVDGGTSVTDQSETGTYHLGTDGNVYFVPDTGTKDAVTAAATSSTPDYANEVLGTAGGDVIAGDSGSEVIFGGTSASPAGTGADTIDGGAGGDVIHGGDGNDIVEGGGDDDVIFGGDGNDEIYGDAAAPVITSTETLEWISGARGGGTDLSSGFVHDSGGMQVSVSFTNDGGNTGISGSTSAQYVGTTGLDPNSGVLLTGGAGPNVTASISFEADAGSGLSNEVENVVFLINDVDADGWEDIITVNAYDVDGNPVAVTLTALGGDTVSGQTVTAEAGDRDSASEIDGAVLVEIAGPVHSIEIVYENGGTSGQALWVSDVQYDTLAPEDGDDEIEGGSGDDLIYGGGGDDTIHGDFGPGGAGDTTVVQALSIDNASFEQTSFGEGGFSSGIPGWTITGTGSGEAGDYNPASSEIDESSVDGDNVAYLYHGGSSSSEVAISQTLSETYTAGNTYDFSLDIGDGAYSGSGDVPYEVNIYAGSTVIGTISGSTGDIDGLQTVTVQSTVEDAGLDGQPITIEIVLPQGAPGGEFLVDNVTGTVTSTVSQTPDPGDDTLFGDAGNDMIDGGEGADLVYGGDGNDMVTLGAGDDTVDGGAGNDTLSGDAGDDVFSLTGAFGDDQITGGETGETAGDTLDASDLTADLTVLLSDPETGTLGDGASTATFAEIEGIELGSGADEVQGSSGDDMVATGAGADIVDGGAGNDTFDVGSLDGAVDTVVLENGDGDTVVLGFEAPINDRGSIVGMDRLDVSNLLDGNGDPVDTSDVVLTDDGSGNARLEFPDGTSILLIGVSPTDVGSPELLEAMGIPLPVRDFTVSGTPGDDIIDGFYSLDPEGDVVDGNDAQDLSNDDIIEAGTGNDFVNAGDGNDIVFGGTGNDTLVGEGGDDTLFGGDGQDILNGVDGNDALYGGGGADSIEAGLGDDIVSGGGGDDSVNGDQGNDTVFGGEGNDFIRGSFGNDTVYGGEGDDYVWGGYGDDLHVVEDNFGNDTYFGDSEQEILGDTLDLSAVTSDLTVDLTDGNNENGSFTDGTSTATFTEIETIVLGGGVDTIVLSNTSGADAVTGFAAPTDNGDGTYSGNDQLDVSALTSDGTTPVHSGNVVVGADTDGNAVLTFPSGASITLVGIAPSDVTDTAALEAMGIPPDPRDGTVSGTAAGDVINVGYAGDPDGDRVDNNDAFLPGDTGNDDLIEAGAGNDFIIAGDGDDVIHGGADSDTIIQNDGSDVDTIFGGEAGADDDRVDFASSSDPGGVTVTFDGDEQGSYIVGTSGASGQFFEIEQIAATGFDDTVDASADTSGILVDGLGGDDTITGGSGDDVLSGWDGDDLIGGGAGNDTVDGDAGNDVLNGGLGNDVVVGDGGDDTLIGGAGADQLFGGAGNDSLQVAEGDFVDGGAGDDYITLVDYGETGNSTLTVSGGAGGESAGDTLQLGSLADLSTLSATDDGTGSFSGSVTLDDGTILNFSEIENIICFTPGTRIATPRGARRVEELAVGDTVVTRDHGIQPIRWIGRRDVPARGRLAPIRLTPGVVTGLERDILVSPQHRMLFQGYRAELLFGESEVLVPAKHLVDGLAARVEEGSTVTYIHLLCDDHEILYAEGAATESFHPGEVGLTAVTAQAREELFTIFPELRALPRSFGPTARRALRRHESRLLL